MNKFELYSLIFQASNTIILLNCRLEEADYIWRYSWFLSRYYPDPPDESAGWWLHPINSLLDYDDDNLNNLSPTLTRVGEAYDRPWHLRK